MSDLWLPLSKGFKAVIDEADAWVAEFKWSARQASPTLVYAVRQKPLENGKRKLVCLHRELLGVEDRRLLVDHIDGDGLNNRRKGDHLNKPNLRVVDHQGNRRNIAGGNGGSGFLGVYLQRGRWRSMIRVDGRLVNLGSFDTREAAHAARLEAELKYWGPQPRREHLYADNDTGGNTESEAS